MINELKYEEMTQNIVKNSLINIVVWGIADPKIKFEKEDVTGKGDITKMKRWHKKSTFKGISF